LSLTILTRHSHWPWTWLIVNNISTVRLLYTTVSLPVDVDDDDDDDDDGGAM
jgi:hypothetical protein